MSLINWSPSQPADCSIAAWIGPGHGFVEFNCANTTSSIGFYPSSGFPNAEPIVEKIETICEQELKGEIDDFVALIAKNQLNRRLQQLNQGDLGAQILKGMKNAPIVQQTAGRVGDISSFVGSTQGVSSGSRLSSKGLSACGKSTPGCGSSSGKSSPSLKIGASPSISVSFNQLPSSGSLFSGWSSLSAANSAIYVNNQVKGWVKKDACALRQCVYKEIPCLMSRIETTHDKVEKAWKEVESIKQELAVDESIQCPVGPFSKSMYKLWGANCLDFMARIMDSTGISNWRQKMEYTFDPGAKAGGIAWQYFNWVLKPSKGST